MLFSGLGRNKYRNYNVRCTPFMRLLICSLGQLIEVFSQTGVSLDPIYTLKGVQGMLGELNSNPGRFAGKRILYIHTGTYS